jgi:hypothetical protein
MYRVLADEFEESRWEILLYDSADEVVQLLCHQCAFSRDWSSQSEQLITGIKPHLSWGINTLSNASKPIFAANSPCLARIYCHLPMPLLLWPWTNPK